MKIKKYIIRFFCYIIGMMFVAAGVVVAINANLGISPGSSVSRSLHMILQHYGITMFTLGNCVTFIYCIFVVLQIFILGKNFPIINLCQMAVAFLFGWFVDICEILFQNFYIPTYAGNLVMLAISIIFLVVGVSLYLGANIMSMPVEGVGLALVQRLNNCQYSKIKLILDCSFVLVSTIAMFAVTGNIGAIDESGSFNYLIREGTVITALAVGPAMGILTKKVLNPLLFSKLFDEGKTIN